MSPVVPTSTVTAVAAGRAERFSMAVSLTDLALPPSETDAVSSDRLTSVDSVVAGVSFETARSSNDTTLLPAASASASRDGAV